jgi:hypothetical protein
MGKEEAAVVEIFMNEFVFFLFFRNVFSLFSTQLRNL